MNTKTAAAPARKPAPFKPARLPTRWSMGFTLLAPLLAVVVLAMLMAATVWYLTESEESQHEQALINDVNAVQRAMHDKLQRHQDDLIRLSETFAKEPNARQLKRLADSFFVRNQEVIFMGWIDGQSIVRSVVTSQSVPSHTFDTPGAPLQRSASRVAFDLAIGSKIPHYSQPVPTTDSDTEVDLHIPILKDTGIQGTIVASYSLPSLLLSTIPAEIGGRVVFVIVDENNRIVAKARNTDAVIGKPYAEAGFEPFARSLRLRGYSVGPDNLLYNDVVITLIGGLILLAALSQFVVWRNTRKRLGVETELAEETTFRRAMENSMYTGMRVIDLNGFITYVNPAFSRMVGFSAEELMGCGPPFPYWPPDSADQLQKNLDRMLNGESPPSGMPLHIMRKDGTRLIVRMYTSPLIDQHGKQTGWMSSVTDITEQTHIRQELALAQERFITVLQSLDAAVSVTSPAPQEELLFANQAYRKWFGESVAQGHRFLSDAARGPRAEARDVFSPVAQRWFEVRVRNIQWVDGRAVELMVATDITQERASEQAQREQHEKLQQTSRLITMGEMASSLAHELNQPLTAIANYTSGAVSRLRGAQGRGDTVSTDELIDLLEKTSRQAERAGQVIRRIRGFVKRSDPIRKPVKAETILADAVGLAEIDARERGVQIATDLESNLPMLHADAILIEQVLLNLIKNGLEAMKNSVVRVLQVQVGMSEQQIMFSVMDAGHGVPPSIRERLFDSFYTTKDDGMGMGLNICRSIIESHQGRLWFEDNPQGGCTFRFTIPVLPAGSSNTVLPTEAFKA